MYAYTLQSTQAGTPIGERLLISDYDVMRFNKSMNLDPTRNGVYSDNSSGRFEFPNYAKPTASMNGPGNVELYMQYEPGVTQFEIWRSNDTSYLGVPIATIQSTDNAQHTGTDFADNGHNPGERLFYKILPLYDNTAALSAPNGSVTNFDAACYPQLSITIPYPVAPSGKLVVLNTDGSPISGAPIQFADTEEGSSAAPTVSLLVRNDGDAAVIPGPILVPAGFSVVSDPDISLSPGASETVTVQRNTIDAGISSGSLVIGSANGPKQSIPVVGTVFPASLDLGLPDKKLRKKMPMAVLPTIAAAAGSGTFSGTVAIYVDGSEVVSGNVGNVINLRGKKIHPGKHILYATYAAADNAFTAQSTPYTVNFSSGKLTFV